MTYKYCKLVSWSSCGTSFPERFASPRSLFKIVTWNTLLISSCESWLIRETIHVGRPNLHSYNTFFFITCNMKPCARSHKDGIPTLQDIVGIDQTHLEGIQGITCLGHTRKLWTLTLIYVNCIYFYCYYWSKSLTKNPLLGKLIRKKSAGSNSNENSSKRPADFTTTVSVSACYCW